MIQDTNKKLSIEDIKVGQEVFLETGVRPIHVCEITYIGKGVGAYKDEFDNEFTFATRSVNFYEVN